VQSFVVALHVNGMLQVAHAMPPVPQAAFVLPLRHALFWQQPSAQLPTPHVSTHWRVTPLHEGAAPFCVQSTQLSPLPPQALSWMPAVHVLPKQHPVLHVIEQPAGWHVPP
jgi:hypothetical protein